jgi:uncharacterized protein YjeT (DUF2065 family)
MHSAIAGIFSLSLMALGISYMVQTRHWVALYQEFESYPRRFIFTGMFILVTGLFVAINFNDWSSTWPIFITAFGWLMAVEAGIMLLRPSLAGWMTRKLGRRLPAYLRLGGLLIFGLGCLLVWEYLLQSHF